MSDQVASTILTAILSPMVCLVVYLYWKTERAFKKTMRRIELVEAIKENWEVKAAITDLITKKIESDYTFQQAIVTLVIDQLQKDWKLEKAVISIAKKA